MVLTFRAIVYMLGSVFNYCNLSFEPVHGKRELTSAERVSRKSLLKFGDHSISFSDYAPDL